MQPKLKSDSEYAREKTHAISLFNEALEGLVVQLNKDLNGARFMLVDAYGISRSSVASNVLLHSYEFVMAHVEFDYLLGFHFDQNLR